MEDLGAPEAIIKSWWHNRTWCCFRISHTYNISAPLQVGPV